MERMRRVASGQLSQLFGASTVTIDKYFRSVGLHRDAEVTFANLGTEERQML
jgi:penicillin amidase